MAFSWYKTATTDYTQAGSSDSSSYPLTIGLDGNVQAIDPDFKTVGNGGFVQSSSGFDIRPYADAGLTTPLTFELVFYNPATGALEMHVQLPTLSHTSAVTVYMAFGDATVTTDGSSSSTWLSAFQHVYHFKDGTTLSPNDSTSNARNGTLLNTPTATAGQIDGGINFASASSQCMTTAMMSQPTSYAWQFWLKSPAAPNTSVLGEPMNYAQNNQAFGFSWNHTSAGFKQAAFQRNSGGTFFTAAITSSLSANTWYLVHARWDGTNLRIYLNGSFQATVAVSSIFSFAGGANNSSFGGRLTTSSFNGVMDEVRIANNSSVVTDDWITADYNSQKASSTFLTRGAKSSTTATTTRNQSGVARITATTTKTQSGVARVTVSTLRTQNGVSRVTRTTQRTQSAVANIKNTTLRTQSGVANIFIPTLAVPLANGALGSFALGSTPVAGGQNPGSTTSTRTQTGVARITSTTSKTQPAVARVTAQTLRTQSALSRITSKVTKTQPAVCRITAKTVRTQSGVANIQTGVVTTTKTQSAVANIRNTTLRTQTGTARITATSLKTQTGIARIGKTALKTQLGTSRITAVTTKTQPSQARITAKTVRTQTGVARIGVTVTLRTQSAIARITTKSIRIQTGIARIGTIWQPETLDSTHWTPEGIHTSTWTPETQDSTTWTKEPTHNV